MSQPTSSIIVFIHGSGDNARVWRPQTTYFGPQRALAIDLPGHGQRPDTLAPDVTVQEYAHATYEIVTNELYLQRPIIAGHSLGGAVALTMAIEYGAQLGGLILVGTGARLRVHPTLLDDAQLSPEAAQTRLSSLALARSTPLSVAQETMREQQAEGATGTSVLYRDLAACNIFDIMPHLSEIALPTLILCGEDDRLTPPKYSEYLHQHIPGSTLRIIANAGHYVMREQAQAVNSAIEQWLYEIPVQ